MVFFPHISSNSLDSNIYKSGVFKMEMGLSPLKDEKIFWVDEQRELFLENKCQAREEAIQKYYATRPAFSDPLKSLVAEQLQKIFKAEWPGVWDEKSTVVFSDQFDAFCSQVQEDIAVVQVSSGTNKALAIHLCAPNHWDANDKIDKDFLDIHQPVPGMTKINSQIQNVLESLVQSGAPVTRSVWGLSTDTRLNHHPIAPQGMNPEEWQGRSFDPKNPKLYVRVERQVLLAIPQSDLLVFTIRTFFKNVLGMDAKTKQAIAEAVRGMPADIAAYKGLGDAQIKEAVCSYLLQTS
ncbi:MAG: DUF3445 domain-containing protein [Deltaproteobacteria bacterium]|nr:DUF3445 domain-containing protein [Deltaproteobacteria bacterium]